MKRAADEDEVEMDDDVEDQSANTTAAATKKKKKQVKKKSKPVPLTKSVPSASAAAPPKPIHMVPKQMQPITKVHFNDIGQNAATNSDHRVEADGVMSWLLGSKVSLDEFYDDYFGVKHLVVKRGDSNYYKSFFTKDSIDKMLKSNCLKFSENIDVTNYVDGERQTLNPEGRAYPAQVWKHYREGCSIRLLNPQTFNANVWRVLSTLQTHFQCGMGANVYLTPAGAQGFAPHYDDVDVFIIQLEGKKVWRLYPPRSEQEVLAKKSSDNFEQEEIGEPIVEVTLEAGDVMYFPRGVIHQAYSPEDVHSLHITISTYMNNTWGDLIGKVLTRALDIANDEYVEFREGLPRDYTQFLGVMHSDKAGDERRKELLDKVGTLWEKLGQCLPTDVGADLMAVKFLHDSLPPVFNQLEKKHSIEDDNAASELKLESRVRLIRQDSIRIVHEDIAVCYHNMDNTRVYHQVGTEPGVIEFTLECVDAIEHLIDSYPTYISIKDLPAESDLQKLDVANALYEKGLLMIEK
ncbi:transcription factor jumonji [Heterostelium album PN500]|uniref:Bifunctional lysine-specific demethylase and histidyl-hydroxylase n=1 Tax=Heterostelium pallidum (strain ATCC 26659 / Pp 5 / PN500) TaxID=670386 RepID=D3B2I1_HETP5|nr:transcription factor jumonji [Heterostelium album PN500]EFA83529.1 transcription factor jumonji [Heterostelium album PN500]|eukprot:XP_020435646.1 transcription factor jumonji [Heterostelium album PN500]